MADAAAEHLLENLGRLLLYRSDLISDAKTQLEKLAKDLRLFKAFLAEQRGEDEDSLVREIRDVVYEVDDIICAVVTQAVDLDSEHYFLRAFDTSEKFLIVSGKVESICGKIRDIYGHESLVDFSSLSIIGDEGPQVSEAPMERQDVVVGVEDEAQKVIGYLTEEARQLDVLTIIGIAGLGKTTLAGKVFRDPAIQYEFPTRIWVYVSQQFTNKDIFLTLLRAFTRVTEEMHCKSDHELARLVGAHLDRRKFLVVMDDVWKAEDWDKLKIAFPESNNMGRVLITSRHMEVAQCANRDRPPHELRFLSRDESWLLFQMAVFGKPDECPPELEVVGEQISELCKGLPLAIMVTGGILVKKVDGSCSGLKAWVQVSESLNTYHNENPLRRMEKIISLSYDKLPHHLKACFLYLGMFPEDFEIPVWKLIRMWIAEGLIQQKAGISQENTAEYYLDHLIDRNLVKIDKIKSDGKVKTCRIHDMVRDFCKNEAGSERENFYKEITKSKEGVFEPPIADIHEYRRLSIHSDADTLDYLSSKSYGPRVRSFVCFSRDEINLPPENLSAIPRAFKLLRVLDVQPIKFQKVLRSMYQLVHLNYIVLSFNLGILPVAFSRFWNIQTLVVETTSPTLDVRADIWGMIHLRHFKTNASASLPKTDSKGGNMLQTLGTISPESCTEDVLNKARNLKELCIRGQLTSLLDGENGSFDSVGKLTSLEKLKLINGVFYSILEGKLFRLPLPNEFPPKLKSLTLSDTFLDWSQMSILGQLANLEVLKLKDNAFVGERWEAVDEGFRSLQVLHIGSTNLVFWVASSHHFPKLKRLELRNCEELREVPIGMADIPSLQVLDLYRTASAAASAKKIYDAKQRKYKDQASQVIGVFKLSIFPPHEVSPFNLL